MKSVKSIQKHLAQEAKKKRDTLLSACSSDNEVTSDLETQKANEELKEAVQNLEHQLQTLFENTDMPSKELEEKLRQKEAERQIPVDGAKDLQLKQLLEEIEKQRTEYEETLREKDKKLAANLEERKGYREVIDMKVQAYHERY